MTLHAMRTSTGGFETSDASVDAKGWKDKVTDDHRTQKTILRKDGEVNYYNFDETVYSQSHLYRKHRNVSAKTWNEKFLLSLKSSNRASEGTECRDCCY